MSKQVVVTGLGVVSPAGCVLNEVWRTVTLGSPCISKLDDSIYYGLPSKVACKVPRGLKNNMLDINKYVSSSKLRSMSLATAYAIAAAKEALLDSDLILEDDATREETGVCMGVGMVNLDDVIDGHFLLNKQYSAVSPYFVPKVLPNMAASQISIDYKLQGPVHCVSTACATGVHSIGDAFSFIKSGMANVMIAGSAEALISPLSVAGFCRLRALSTSFNETPQKASRPFDKSRDGFVIGEGAAVLILEEMEHAIKRGARIYAEIKGYGLSGDGYHLTSPHLTGKGAKLAMKRALNSAQLSLNSVTYINAHAASTSAGDATELNAVKTLFGDHAKNLIISSTKGVHGHLLGAAGSLEVLLTVYACYSALIPPTANLEEPCEEANSLNCISEKQDWNKNERVALKNSFGFGGMNACLCISNLLSNE